MTTRDPLHVGRRYKVRFRPSDEPRAAVREIEGRYLGWNQFYTRHDFDLRPEHGTTGLLPTDIVECIDVTP